MPLIYTSVPFSVDELKAVIHYDPETGEIFKRRAKGRLANTGSLYKSGYLLVFVFGKRYLAHRLAWMYATGMWPDHYIDHINGNPSDNRWSNLRSATLADNCRNARKHRPKYALPIGVSYGNARNTIFRARIKVGGRQYELGAYKSASEASEVFQLASEMLHGEYAYHLSRQVVAHD